MIRDFMRKDLENFKPYHTKDRTYEIKVDNNENPYPHSPEVIKKLQAWVMDSSNLARYPDTDATTLAKKLAELYGVGEKQILVGSGSNELIDCIIKVFVAPEDVVLVPNPSFSLYIVDTVVNHGKPVPYDLGQDFAFDYDQIIDKYKIYRPKLVFIHTPNSPTANKASVEGLTKILDQVKCPVVVDEAYLEFTEGSMIDSIADYPNLIVLRSFSKAYGLAGLRVGYALANEEMLDIIGVAKQPFTVDRFSQAAATYVLEDLPYYQGNIKKIKKDRQLVADTLKKMPMIQRVYDSEANFLLVWFKDMEAVAYLESKGILIRRFKACKRLKDHVRITIGTYDENNRILALLTEYANKGGQ